MNDGKHCHVEPLQKAPTAEEQAQVIETRLAIWGMGCPNCANRVRNSLLGLEGVIQADVNHLYGEATVRHNPSMASLDQLIAAVAAAGGDGHHEYSAALLQ